MGDSLVLIAERSNPKRSFLLVSTVLGKHVPVAGARCRLAGLTLGLVVAGDPRAAAAQEALLGTDAAAIERCCAELTATPAAPTEPIVVIGFAETATALGEQVAAGADAVWWQTTTRRAEGAAGLPFAEVHSHAPEQWVLAPAGGWPDGVMVLVDDELSTGATAARLVEAIHGVSPRERYVVAALVDSRPDGADGPLDATAAALGARIDVIALERRGPTPDRPAGWSGGTLPQTPAQPPTRHAVVREVEVTCPGPRQHAGQDRSQRLAFAQAAAATPVRDLGAGALVLGTGEHLAAAQHHAAALGALTSSTTRSPVLVAGSDGYPITAGLAFANPDGPGVPGYAYNVRAGSRPAVVVHFPDREHRERGEDLLAALARDGARELIAVTMA
ncbi:hypothetical protein DSM112329_02681 [Paraconexibacter sp. AEG42_29]|uniref:Phosphoribosyltransferase n=1 Tax=Paraconexibacter sp. AEG42_29 TaxID=2997339 RepID=A0AAU7AVS8_9ACTN